MDKVTIFREQAAYCAYLLRRTLDPRRRALIERERQDWLMLAYQDGFWSEIEVRSPPGRGLYERAADEFELPLEQ